MTQPATPTPPAAREVVLGPGAYGDPARAGLTRVQFEAQESPATGPSNPSSEPVADYVPVPQDSTPVGDELPPVPEPVPATAPVVAP